MNTSIIQASGEIIHALGCVYLQSSNVNVIVNNICACERDWRGVYRCGMSVNALVMVIICVFGWELSSDLNGNYYRSETLWTIHNDYLDVITDYVYTN